MSKILDKILPTCLELSIKKLISQCYLSLPFFKNQFFIKYKINKMVKNFVLNNA